MFRRNIASARDYLFTKLKYMGSAVESYLIGDLRQIIMGGSNFQSDLNEKGFKSLGFFGNIQVIKPRTKEALAALLKEIDPKAKSRSLYKMLDEVVEGKPFFTEPTSANALHHRTQLMPYLNNSQKYREIIHDIMQEMFDKESNFAKQLLAVNDRRNAGHILVQRIMAKLIFNLDRLPAGAIEAIQQMDQQFEQGVIESAFPRVPQLFKSKVEKRRLQDAKEAFANFSQRFLDSQLTDLLPLIQHSRPNRPTGNLTADMIADMMRKDKKMVDLAEITEADLRPYLTHPDIKALPWLFIAGTNISRTLNHAFWKADSDFSEDFVKEFALLVLDHFIQHYDTLPTFSDKSIHNWELVNRSRDLMEQYLTEVSHLEGNSMRNFPQQLLLEKLGLPQFVTQAELLTKADLEKRRETLREEKAAENLGKASKNEDVAKRLIAGVRAEISQLNPQTMEPYDSHQTPALDAFYDYSTQYAVGTLRIARYAQHAVTIGDLKIPANTTVFIELNKIHAMELNESKEEQTAPRDPHEAKESKASAKMPFYFFSAGPRMCPGTRLAENIFKIAMTNYIPKKDANHFEALQNLKKRLGQKASASITLKLD